MQRRHASTFLLGASAVCSAACGPLVAIDDAGGDTGGETTDAPTSGDTRPSSAGDDPRPPGEVGGEVGSEGGEDEGDITGEPPNCGDGILDAGEVCDDGNDTPGDGCESDCTASPGQLLWETSFDALLGNDVARAVAVMKVTGTIVVVGTADDEGNDDVWLRSLLPDGTLLTDIVSDLGSDDEGTSVVAMPDGRGYVAALQPDDDRAALLQLDEGLVTLDGGPTDIAAFTASVTETSEGFAMVTNAGGFDDITPTVRRFDPDGTVIGDVAQTSGVFVVAAAALPDGGTVLGGGRFGGMGMGGSVWLSALDSAANARWISELPVDPGSEVRVRALTSTPDGQIVGVGSQGLGGPGDESSTGWVWWWDAEGTLTNEYALEIGGASSRPNTVVHGEHGLVIGGSTVLYEDGFVAGFDAFGGLLWGYTLTGDLGAEDSVTALAIAPEVGIVAVGYATNAATGRDGWTALFSD